MPLITTVVVVAADHQGVSTCSEALPRPSKVAPIHAPGDRASG